MKKKSVRIITGILCIVLLLTASVVPAAAVKEDDATVNNSGTTANTVTVADDEYDYYAYMNDNADKVPATKDIVLDGSAYSSESGSEVVAQSEYEGQTNVV